jgi:hypothetical protein
MAEKEQTCSIYRKPYEGFGHDAQPVNDGRCCDVCNITVVIPMRLEAAQKGP